MDRARSPICSYKLYSGLGRRLLAVRVIYHREMNPRDIMIVGKGRKRPRGGGGGEKTDAIFLGQSVGIGKASPDKNGNSHDDLFLHLYDSSLLFSRVPLSC